MAVYVTTTQGTSTTVQLVVALVILLAIVMASKITVSMGPLKMTMHKARKRRKRGDTSRRRHTR